jgi:hypothetical protein
MRNQTTGLYEVRKEFKSTGHVYVGTGETQEAAKKDLKAQLEKIRYYPTPAERALLGVRANLPIYRPTMVPTGETIRSPGYEAVQFKNGSVGYRLNANRQVSVMARPDLAALIQKQRADDEAAEAARVADEASDGAKIEVPETSV